MVYYYDVAPERSFSIFGQHIKPETVLHPVIDVSLEELFSF